VLLLYCFSRAKLYWLNEISCAHSVMLIYCLSCDMDCYRAGFSTLNRHLLYLPCICLTFTLLISVLG
jgi:hypothetical protein